MPEITLVRYQKRKSKKRRRLNIHKLRLETAQTPKQLRKKLDVYFSTYIRLRDKDCFMDSGCSGPIQAGHLITRGATRTRWDDRNCFGSCRGHNFLHEYRPEIMTQWYIGKYGIEQYNEIVRLSRISWKPTKSELLALIEKYKVIPSQDLTL